jgi:predicted ATPase/DNA-binding SARP family transcriptional activator
LHSLALVLRYRVLGPLEVADEDRPIAVPSAQQRLLLSMLLLEAGRTVPSGSLIDELWRNCLPSEPAAALRTQVSRLRRRLGAGAGDLVTEAEGYRLHVGAGCLDASVFGGLVAEGRFDEAIELWRGPALGEFADRDFAQVAAARLEEQRLEALEGRATDALAGGRPHDAVADLEPLLAAEPGRERVRGALMQALYSIGRQTDALALFDDWRRELIEHGLEPGPDLVELERRILQHRVPDAGPAFPVAASSFVGREHDLATTAATLGAARVVTLCGPGGAGKTRLALELSRRLLASHPDGVRFCDLGTLHRPAEVERAVAATLGVPDSAPRPVGDQLVDQVIERVAGRKLVLVLDNCEHLIGAVARVVDRIVSHTTGISVLATSRERLGVDGEVVQPVEPLDAAAATELFIDRARAVDPAFGLEEQSVHEICTRLDRLPLAIELAAACMRGISATELASALHDPLGLLSSGSRTVERHASLAAMIDWSYELLSLDERSAFDRFGVFAGRVDAETARAVTGASLGVLLRLVDRSVVTSYRASVTQYSMLETIRSYAVARLRDRGQLEGARDDHAAWAVDLAEHASSRLSGPDEAEWAARLARHSDELRAAHVWMVGRDPEAALRLSAALHPWAFWRGRSDVFRMAEVAAAANMSTGSPLLAEVQSSAAVGAWQRGDLAAAEAGARAAAGHRRAVEVLADLAFLRGDLSRARSLFLDAAARAEEANDTLQAVWDRGSAALALHYDGRDAGGEPERVLAIAEASGSTSARSFAHFVIGEVEASEAHLTAAAELAEQVGSEFLSSLAAVSLAAAMAHDGLTGPALEQYERAIRAWHHVGAWSPMWVTLRTFVRLLTELDLDEEAAILHGAALTPRSGPAPFGADAVLMHNAAEALLDRLGSDEFEAHRAAGRALTDDDVVKVALQAVDRARDLIG